MLAKLAVLAVLTVLTVLAFLTVPTGYPCVQLATLTFAAGDVNRGSNRTAGFYEPAMNTFYIRQKKSVKPPVARRRRHRRVMRSRRQGEWGRERGAGVVGGGVRVPADTDWAAFSSHSAVLDGGPIEREVPSVGNIEHLCQGRLGRRSTPPHKLIDFLIDCMISIECLMVAGSPLPRLIFRSQSPGR